MATSIIIADFNTPQVGELVYDLNLVSPIQQLYRLDTFIVQSAEKVLAFFSR